MYIVVCELWGGCDDCQIFGASCCYVDSQRRKEAHYSQAVTVHNTLLLVYFTVQTEEDIARLSAVVADSKPVARKLAQRVQQLPTQS